MRNPVTRLLYIGVLLLGISIAMIVENYLSKSNSTWEYIFAIAILVFALVFMVGSFKIGNKKK